MNPGIDPAARVITDTCTADRSPARNLSATTGSPRNARAVATTAEPAAGVHPVAADTSVPVVPACSVRLACTTSAAPANPHRYASTWLRSRPAAINDPHNSSAPSTAGSGKPATAAASASHPAGQVVGRAARIRARRDAGTDTWKNPTTHPL